MCDEENEFLKNPQTVLELIRAYEAKPVVWDPTHPHFGIRRRKYEAWVDIANKFNTNTDIIKGKMSSLLAAFRREKARIRHGYGKGEVYVSKWFAFDSLRFLLSKDAATRDLVHTNVDGNEVYIVIEEEPDNTAESDDVASVSKGDKRKIVDSPKSHEKQKKEKLEDSPNVNAAYSLLKSIVNTPEDECYTYGQYIISKLRKFDEQTQHTVKHKFNQIIFEAEMGMYNNYANTQSGGCQQPTPQHLHKNYDNNTNEVTLSTHSADPGSRQSPHPNEEYPTTSPVTAELLQNTYNLEEFIKVEQFGDTYEP